jgi:hypothetical protein
MGDGLVREIGNVIYFSFYLVAVVPIPALQFTPAQSPNDNHPGPMESEADSTKGAGF